ncbi:MAG: prolipoprotein diacylglyceryl transferase [Anaerolineae bacterium]|nr:prolipoprotein diacylglyceryl transferase [Anaerolineae bacterium]
MAAVLLSANIIAAQAVMLVSSVAMFPEIGHIGPIVIRTYTLLLDLAVLIGLGALARHGQHAEGKPGRWVDIGLLALVGGLIGGRLEHVAIHWAYFAEHPNEIVRIWQGGIGWHGAVLLGLLILAIGGVARNIKLAALTDALSIPLALGSLLIYTGCLGNRCGHGREVESLADYPFFLAMELPDMYGVVAPRLASQLYGVAFSIIMLMIALLLARRMTRQGIRFWLVLAMLGLGAFGIGFTRGDSNPMIGPLRLDQVLDISIVLISIAMALRAARQPVESKSPSRRARHFDIIQSGDG